MNAGAQHSYRVPYFKNGKQSCGEEGPRGRKVDQPRKERNQKIIKITKEGKWTEWDKGAMRRGKGNQSPEAWLHLFLHL